MSAPGEQVPSAEARIAVNDIEETALTIQEKKEDPEKAPISNFWVRYLQSSMVYVLLIHDSAYSPFEQGKMGSFSWSVSAALSEQG
jgi:hypothetical protein